MKMVNDMDLYYAHVYTKECEPMWMRSERIDFCDTTVSDRRISSFLRSIFHKKAN